MKISRITTGEIVIGVIALIAVLILAFLNLSALPIRLWDESRLANSAFEMYRDGWSIVVNYNGEPDLWSTKPPLLIWIQVALMHITGPGELPIRFPSAASVVFTCMGFIYILSRLGLSVYLGAIAALILVTFTGFNEAHTGRTGDYEALLALFTTFSAWGFYFSVKTGFKQARYIYFFFAMITLGFMTKSIAAWLFAPAWLLWLISQKQLIAALRSKHVYIAAVGSISFLAAFHFLRESASPGYLSAVWINDLFGRYGTTMDEHQHGFMHYFENFFHTKGNPYVWTSIAGVAVLFIQRDKQIRNIGAYSLLLFLGYMLVISGSATKLYWYDNPVYPFAALLSAIFLWQVGLWSMMLLSRWINAERYRGIVYMLVIAVGVAPNYIYRANRYINAQEAPEYYANYHVTYMLRSMYKDQSTALRDLTGYTVVYDQYDAHNLFYHQILDYKGERLYRKHINEVTTGDSVVIWSDFARNHLLLNFKTELLWEEDNGRTQAYYVIPAEG